MKTVYVSGPYTKGDVCVNVRDAVLAGDRILKAGFFPYVPHLTHFWHYLTPRPWQDWMALDLVWLAKCDAMLRLPGESKGADIEEAKALELGIPVFRSLLGLMDWANGGGRGSQ